MRPGDDAPLPAPARDLPIAATVRVRVRYCECDPMGVAHHGAYPAWLELARTEILRAGGVSYADLEAAGVFLVVSRLELRYRRPARYDEEIEVTARVVGGGRARIDHAYEVTREGPTGREAVAEATSTLACVGRDGRPTALPGWLQPARAARGG